MAIELSTEARKQAIASLTRFLAEHVETEVSDLQATALLNFFLEEIGPSAYNLGVADAQTHLRDRIADLDGVCFEPEFPYWPRTNSRRRK